MQAHLECPHCHAVLDRLDSIYKVSNIERDRLRIGMNTLNTAIKNRFHLCTAVKKALYSDNDIDTVDYGDPEHLEYRCPKCSMVIPFLDDLVVLKQEKEPDVCDTDNTL